MLSRRQFVVWAAGAIPVGFVIEKAHAISLRHLAAAPETLDALGDAILPPELGSVQIGRIVAGFRKWIADYRENAEVNHTYGNSRLRTTGPTPATRWTKQLDDLDVSARAKGGTFAALTVPQRQAIIRAALAAERAIPSSPDGGTHVAAALLGFFYSSPDASDLCYEVSIGKNTCRPLANSSKHPAPRARSTGGRLLPVRSSVEAGS